MILTDQGLVFNDGQFCISINQKSLLKSKGRFMVQLCLQDKVKLKGKFQFYYIFMIISVASLSITIFIYMLLRDDLLR